MAQEFPVFEQLCFRSFSTTMADFAHHHDGRMLHAGHSHETGFRLRDLILTILMQTTTYREGICSTLFVHIYTYTNVYIHICVCTYICIYIYTHVHMYTSTYVSRSIQTWVVQPPLYVCLYVFMYVCMYVCMFVFNDMSVMSCHVMPCHVMS